MRSRATDKNAARLPDSDKKPLQNTKAGFNLNTYCATFLTRNPYKIQEFVLILC